MNFSIVVDTNFLFVSKIKDFTEVKFIHNLERLTNMIIDNNLNNKVKIIIPRIVEKELIKQQSTQYYENISRLKSIKLPNMDISVDEDYFNTVERKFESEIEKLKNDRRVNIKIIDYPMIENFHNTIERAIEKKPPFVGKQKESDKGFKDTILWESLIEYKNNNKNEVMILLTRDNIFSEEILINEYKKLFSEDIIIIESKEKEQTIMDLINTIKQLANLNIRETEEEKIYNKFKSVIANSNFSSLYEGLSYESFRTGVQYTFYKLEIEKFNFLGMQKFIENGVEINYFVVEIKLNLLFINDLGEFTSQETFSDYWEYEVNHCREDDSFIIIGRDCFFDEPYDVLSRKIKLVEVV